MKTLSQALTSLRTLETFMHHLCWVREAARPEHSTGGITYNPFPLAETAPIQTERQPVSKHEQDVILLISRVQTERLEIPKNLPLSEILQQIKATISNLELDKENLEYLSKWGVLLDRALHLATSYDKRTPNTELTGLLELFRGGDEITQIVPRLVESKQCDNARRKATNRIGEFQTKVENSVEKQTADIWAEFSEIITTNIKSPLSLRLTHQYGIRHIEAQRRNSHHLFERLSHNIQGDKALVEAVRIMLTPCNPEELLVGRIIWDLCEKDPECVPGVFRLARLIVLNQLLFNYGNNLLLSQEQNDGCLIADYPRTDGVAFTHVRDMNTHDPSLQSEKDAFRNRPKRQKSKSILKDDQNR